MRALRAIFCVAVCLLLTSCEFIFGSIIYVGNACWDIPQGHNKIALTKPVSFEDVATATQEVASKIPDLQTAYSAPIVEPGTGTIYLNRFRQGGGIGIKSLVVQAKAGSVVEVSTEGIGLYCSKPVERVQQVQTQLVAGLSDKLQGRLVTE